MLTNVALTAEESQIGKRIRLVRKEQGISQRLAAKRMGLSRDQIKRIERGEVAVRFFPAWHFCQLTDTNPLWLASGDPEGRFGFVGCANSSVPGDARFLAVMQKYGERYRTLRHYTHSAMRGAGAVFSDSDAPYLTADFIALNRRTDRGEKKNVGSMPIKRYLITDMAAVVPPTWEDLRAVLARKTESAKAKKALAKRLGVTLAAISQWRSGASAPTADNALQILNWVRGIEAQQKQSAGSAETQPALKTRKRKSKYEKPKSDRKKQ
jgi:transcriptional regulator with XRE-family HTH domain